MSENIRRSSSSLMWAEMKEVTRLFLDVTVWLSVLKRLLKWFLLILLFMVFLPLFLGLLLPENSDLIFRIFLSMSIIAFLANVPLMLLDVHQSFRTEVFGKFAQLSTTTTFIAVVATNVAVGTGLFLLVLTFDLVLQSFRASFALAVVQSIYMIWYVVGMLAFSYLLVNTGYDSSSDGGDRFLLNVYLLEALFFVPLSLFLAYERSLVEILPLQLDGSAFALGLQAFFLLTVVILPFIDLNKIVPRHSSY